MRIAYLVNQYPKVSHSFIRREILALERLGIEIVRIALRGWDNTVVDKEDEIERSRTHYILSNSSLALSYSMLQILTIRPLRVLSALTLTWKMSRRAERPLSAHLAYLVEACKICLLLREMQIHHLHAHFGTNSAEVAMLVNALGGPTWSFTVHGPEEFDKATLIGLGEKIRRSAFVVAISSFGRSQLYRNVEQDHWHKIKVVRCGIEPEFYGNAVQPILSSNTLVCVGRLCEQKGQLLLIEATRRLHDSGIELNLVLAGDGELRSEIETLIERYKLADIVRITGWISSKQVRAEILAARALILPSFAEGLPVVLMEAMSLGKPIISTFVAGIPELVQSGRHGWLVPAGDIEGLMTAITDCLNTPPGTLTLMGSHARLKVLENHDINSEAIKLASLFKSYVDAVHSI